VMAKVSATVPWRPGARELLKDLRSHGVPCALVTMSYQRFVTPILGELPEDSFEVVVTGDSVSQGKPHPEPYLTAARLLGVDPAHTLAIEDSNTCASSAEAAGCAVLVVQHHVEVPSGERRVFVDSLTELGADGSSLDRLSEIVARLR
jgi:HAD superfamily hydrolase (TIGR01509 family)